MYTHIIHVYQCTLTRGDGVAGDVAHEQEILGVHAPRK
jgi:hypothetical protein